MIAGNIDGNCDGNAATVTNGVYNTGVQTLGGTYTFSNDIVGNLTGNVTGNCDGTANKIKNDTVDNDATTGTVGALGEIRFDSSYMYICTLAGRGNWKRVSLSTF